MTDKTYWVILVARVEHANTMFGGHYTPLDTSFIVPAGVQIHHLVYDSIGAILADGWEPIGREGGEGGTRWLFRALLPEVMVKWVCPPTQVCAWVYNLDGYCPSVTFRLGEHNLGTLDLPRDLVATPAGKLSVARWVEDNYPKWVADRMPGDKRLSNASPPKAEHVLIVGLDEEEET